MHYFKELPVHLYNQMPKFRSNLVSLPQDVSIFYTFGVYVEYTRYENMAICHVEKDIPFC